MGQRFTSFVVFAEMRTGSNFLEANLNKMEGVTCYGEVFNPIFVGTPDQAQLMGFDLTQRTASPLDLLQALRDETKGLAGFRFFHDHDSRVLPVVLAEESCAKIILTRNPIESYVSWKIATQTGQWKLTDGKNLKTALVEFDAAEFERHLEALQSFQQVLLHELQVAGQTAFYLDYEDINDLDVLNGLARFLGVAGLKALDGNLKKQNPQAVAQKLSNPDDLAQAMARLDRFNLSRTPNFEPRRGPMVPQFQAALEAGLLHMPIKSGPVEAITHWLETGFGGVQQGLSQKELRQWKRAHPGHRSFSVLRHPVARAHDAFCRQILSGACAEVRGQLEKAYKLPLPPIGQDYPSLAAHQEGFVAFLKWLKLNLGGQTALGVDGYWASQAAVLQGFASFQTPDILLREERLAEGLAYIAAELGLEAPLLAAEAPHGFMTLTMVYDAEIEAACRGAYNKDYVMFGYADWRG